MTPRGVDNINTPIRRRVRYRYTGLEPLLGLHSFRGPTPALDTPLGPPGTQEVGNVWIYGYYASYFLHNVGGGQQAGLGRNTRAIGFAPSTSPYNYMYLDGIHWMTGTYPAHLWVLRFRLQATCTAALPLAGLLWTNGAADDGFQCEFASSGTKLLWARYNQSTYAATVDVSITQTVGDEYVAVMDSSNGFSLFQLKSDGTITKTSTIQNVGTLTLGMGARMNAGVYAGPYIDVISLEFYSRGVVLNNGDELTEIVHTPYRQLSTFGPPPLSRTGGVSFPTVRLSQPVTAGYPAPWRYV